MNNINDTGDTVILLTALNHRLQGRGVPEERARFETYSFSTPLRFTYGKAVRKYRKAFRISPVKCAPVGHSAE